MDYIIQPAKWRTIHYSSYTSDTLKKNHSTYYVPFPRMIFWAPYRLTITTPITLYCGFLDDENNVYYPSLGNIDNNFRVCLGTRHDNQANNFYNLQDAVNYFWQSQFNNDMVMGWVFLQHYLNNKHTFECYAKRCFLDDVLQPKVSPAFERWPEINWKQILKPTKETAEERQILYNTMYSILYPIRYTYECIDALKKLSPDVIEQIRKVRPLMHFNQAVDPIGMSYLGNYYFL